MMFRIGMKMIGECQTVHDILQEVFIYLYEKLNNNGSSVTHFSSWLYRATYFKSIDFLKSQQRAYSTSTLTGR